MDCAVPGVLAEADAAAAREDTEGPPVRWPIWPPHIDRQVVAEILGIAQASEQSRRRTMARWKPGGTAFNAGDP